MNHKFKKLDKAVVEDLVIGECFVAEEVINVFPISMGGKPIRLGGFFVVMGMELLANY